MTAAEDEDHQEPTIGSSESEDLTRGRQLRANGEEYLLLTNAWDFTSEDRYPTAIDLYLVFHVGSMAFFYLFLGERSHQLSPDKGRQMHDLSISSTPFGPVMDPTMDLELV